ncbi:hypothetical protein SLA2020_450710 [Shorea laevis]
MVLNSFWSHPFHMYAKHRIYAHEGGCASILFEYNSGKLISGGQDRSIKIWDTNSGSLSHTLYGCLGSLFLILLLPMIIDLSLQPAA